MLQDVYLYNPHGPDLQLGKPAIAHLPQALKTTRLLIPRQVCVYQRVDCAGVPRLKLAAFAKLQVQSLTPFTKNGACAVRQGNWLHLWMWDAAIEAVFSTRHQNRRPAQVLPRSLYSPPQTHGLLWLTTPGTTAVEAQLWKDNLLVDCMWFDVLPTSSAWDALLAQRPELALAGWPRTLPDNRLHTQYSTSAWGRNLIPQSGPRLGVQLSHLAPAGLVVATATLAGWGGFVYAEKEAHQNAIRQGVETQERLIAELEPMQQARQRTMETLRWIDAAQALSPPPTTHSIITELAGIFTLQGLVVRELEISAPTIQATLVSTAGGSPRLTAVLGALEAHPWFYDARFVDVVGGTGFKFAWRLRSGAGTAVAVKGQP